MKVQGFLIRYVVEVYIIFKNAPISFRQHRVNYIFSNQFDIIPSPFLLGNFHQIIRTKIFQTIKRQLKAMKHQKASFSMHCIQKILKVKKNQQDIEFSVYFAERSERPSWINISFWFNIVFLIFVRYVVYRGTCRLIQQIEVSSPFIG